jgi:hypothetical protein
LRSSPSVSDVPAEAQRTAPPIVATLRSAEVAPSFDGEPKRCRPIARPAFETLGGGRRRGSKILEEARRQRHLERRLEVFQHRGDDARELTPPGLCQKSRPGETSLSTADHQRGIGSPAYWRHRRPPKSVSERVEQLI